MQRSILSVLLFLMGVLIPVTAQEQRPSVRAYVLQQLKAQNEAFEARASIYKPSETLSAFYDRNGGLVFGSPYLGEIHRLEGVKEGRLVFDGSEYTKKPEESEGAKPSGVLASQAASGAFGMVFAGDAFFGRTAPPAAYLTGSYSGDKHLFDTAHFYVNHLNFVPGVGSGERGEREKLRLGQVIEEFEKVKKNIADRNGEVAKDLPTFASEILAPASKNFGNTYIDALKASLKYSKDQFAAMETEPAGEKLTLPEVAASPKKGDSAVPKLIQKTISSKETSRLEKWNAIRDAWWVYYGPDSPVPDHAIEGFRRLITENFNQQGLAGHNILGAEGAAVSDKIATQLKTSLQSPEGIEVRYQVNRSLVTLYGTTSDEAKSEGMGGLAMSLGADQAFADGDYDSGRRLLKAAATAVDIGLGFLPVAGAVNDALQIIHGMATGRDYTGEEMAWFDYGLRGVGVVVGIVGAGGPAKHAVKLAGKEITSAFVSGANLVKRLRLRGVMAEAISKSKSIAAGLTDVIGTAFKGVDDADELYSGVSHTINLLGTSGRQLNNEALYRLSRMA
ncbi:MAG: hypothetical protein KDD39_04150, partial [Bdellovibrionales bacterium]|nr:hypothetical protein [Bdellovibrionales bacterium]